ncbi:hypothetical protein BKA56DRAFT_579713 [Ilyonectria sp. MPI-CAGE-AT-0026]|nr:hypothetical protein BKA56DRAFT_579713 [Ilyonectria sp. MPI-CAGE-AT-0026]
MVFLRRPVQEGLLQQTFLPRELSLHLLARPPPQAFPHLQEVRLRQVSRHPQDVSPRQPYPPPQNA